jgi:hypothetical protein
MARFSSCVDDHTRLKALSQIDDACNAFVEAVMTQACRLPRYCPADKETAGLQDTVADLRRQIGQLRKQLGSSACGIQETMVARVEASPQPTSSHGDGCGVNADMRLCGASGSPGRRPQLAKLSPILEGAEEPFVEYDDIVRVRAADSVLPLSESDGDHDRQTLELLLLPASEPLATSLRHKCALRQHSQSRESCCCVM